ncbi:MAG: bifunctional folylpolyglutamate synthase/dihydrofolate synthase [Rubrobacteraceae bacterium]
MERVRPIARVCDELDRRRHVILGLGRIESLLARLGNPENDLRVVQVVGTNGKGTTAVALSVALEEAGLSTGAYLSPHVLSYTERMMIHGEYVSEKEFATVMELVLETADRHGIQASQFELLTAGALVMFRQAGVTWAVLEAGLGARYDATTAAAPEAVVLTNVGLDHTEYLGETLRVIALEKLASLPEGGLLVLGEENPEIVELAGERCGDAGARLVEVAPPADGPRVENLAPYARRNAHLGVRAAEVLCGRQLEREILGRVLGRVVGVLPGRFETHELRGVPVVVDGGHNLEGLVTALASAREVYGGRRLGVVFGVLREKDIKSMLTALEQQAYSLVLTRPDNERAADPGWIAESYGPRDLRGEQARVVADPDQALDRIVEELEPLNGVVLVTGSLYTGVSILGRLRAG